MLELVHVTKRLKKKTVLDDISYTFESGVVYGLFGVNGSGKTMLLRMLSGLIRPTEGKVIYEGKILHEEIPMLPDVGVVIENMELLPYYTAYENLIRLSKIKNVASQDDIRLALERVGLDPESELKVRKFSLGMKQRLNIAQAFFEKQKIILLDEPTNAVDHKGVQQIYDVIQQEKKRGALIVIATHHDNDLRNMCDEVLLMDSGKLMLQEGCDEENG
ncbi:MULTISPECIES: ABC transporter ATP-binding protein [Hornefia]|uniref:Multidrug ABC transporter ATP-binding protein n=1 Tax=Hornefia porci TaxID=2652292 RepID=A0A1Q9JH40_9FIRM|nr:ABC transporter ATP-binding protein [Hornefia porci]OLR55528.1 multidrug ABC transporter ATP-binding protein [Hornefia porci]